MEDESYTRIYDRLLRQENTFQRVKVFFLFIAIGLIGVWVYLLMLALKPSVIDSPLFSIAFTLQLLVFAAAANLFVFLGRNWNGNPERRLLLKLAERSFGSADKETPEASAGGVD